MEKKDFIIIIVLLVIALCGVSGYLVYDKVLNREIEVSSPKKDTEDKKELRTKDELLLDASKEVAYFVNNLNKFDGIWFENTFTYDKNGTYSYSKNKNIFDFDWIDKYFKIDYIFKYSNIEKYDCDSESEYDSGYVSLVNKEQFNKIYKNLWDKEYKDFYNDDSVKCLDVSKKADENYALVKGVTTSMTMAPRFVVLDVKNVKNDEYVALLDMEYHGQFGDLFGDAKLTFEYVEDVFTVLSLVFE